MNFNEIKRILKLKILKIFIFRGNFCIWKLKFFVFSEGGGILFLDPPWGHKIKIR